MDLSGFNATPRPMSDLRKKVLDSHEGNPQRQALANVGLNELEHAQSVLSGLGHKIVFGFDDSATAAIQFPKMMYFDGENGLAHVEVNSGAEADALRDAGWHDHPSDRPDGGEAAKPEAATEDRSTPLLGEFSPSQYGGDAAGFSHTEAPTAVSSLYEDDIAASGSDTALRPNAPLAVDSEFANPNPNSADRNVVHDSKVEFTKSGHSDGPTADVSPPGDKTV